MGWDYGAKRSGFHAIGKRTGFHAITEQLGASYCFYNNYYMPNDYGDPVSEYWGFRRTAGLCDASGEKNIELRGSDASKLVDYLSTRDISKLKDGQCAYSPLCYDDGGIINDGLILKFSEDRIWYCGGEGKDDAWWAAHARGLNVSVEFVTDEWSILQLQGPRSRDILSRVVAIDLENLPSHHIAETEIAGYPCNVSRTGWTGELGYEVYVRDEYAEAIWISLWEAGQYHDMVVSGLQAIDMRRLEHGTIYDWGGDFNEKHNPYEVNIGWAVNLDKGDFIGKDALAKLEEAPPRVKLVGLELEGPISADYGDTVVSEEGTIGEVTAATYSPYLNRNIALALIEGSKANLDNRFEVQRSQLKIPARVVDHRFSREAAKHSPGSA